MKKTLVLILLITLVCGFATAAFAQSTDVYEAEAAAKQAKDIRNTLIILAFAAFFFVTELIPLAVTAMFVPVLLVWTGVLDTGGALSGLSNKNVMLFAGMFVVGAGLFETGVAKAIGDKVVGIAGGSEIG